MISFLLGVSFSLNVVLCFYIYFTRLKKEEFDDFEVVDKEQVKDFFSSDNIGFH